MADYMTSLADDLPSEDLKLIYKSELRAFHRLVKTLVSDRQSAMEIVGFWNWLESLGFTDTVKKTLSLHESEFAELADESLSCVDFLANDTDQAELRIVTTRLLLGPGFSPELVRDNRESAVESINWFVERVCKRGFDVDEDEDEDYSVIGQREQGHEDHQGQRLLSLFTPRGVFSWISCCMPSLSGVSSWY